MLRNLFRKKDVDELQREADALFDEERYGDAKLAYDKLAERAQKDKPELVSRAEARATESCDRLALKRGQDALTLHASGERELAREELMHALGTARSPAVLTQLHDIERRLDVAEAGPAAPEAAPLSEEERQLLIASSWEPQQAAELERYGEPLLQAAVALELGHADRALAMLTALERPDASYLWLEIGRAHLSRSALDEAEAALRTFLSRIGPDEGGAARLLAHRELARIAHERDDREAAVHELEAACEALTDDPRPLLDLGNYLRLIERAADAVEVLELCVQAFGDDEIEWPVTMELGLACAAAGQDERAIKLLEGVLSALLAKGHRDLPPPAVVGLAALHERAGNVARAADLYRALTEGSDAPNLALYHLEAARLLDVLELTEEAARMRDRARALARPAPGAVDTAEPSA